MDIEDDKKIGVKGTALFFGEKTKYFMYFFLGCISLLIYSYLNSGKEEFLAQYESVKNNKEYGSLVKEIEEKKTLNEIKYNTSLVLLGLVFLRELLQIKSVNLKSRASCQKYFNTAYLTGVGIYFVLLCKVDGLSNIEVEEEIKK